MKMLKLFKRGSVLYADPCYFPNTMPFPIEKPSSLNFKQGEMFFFYYFTKGCMKNSNRVNFWRLPIFRLTIIKNIINLKKNTRKKSKDDYNILMCIYKFVHI